MNLISTLSRRLLQRELPDGGFTEHPDGEFRPDTTAWCILALMVAETDTAAVGLGQRRLSRAQREDGRVNVSRELDEAAWPTPLAVLAWGAAPEYRESKTRAVRFLLDTTGQHGPRQNEAILSHDTALRGWPWTAGTHSWTVPTALAVLALRSTGHSGHARTREAVKMILDRQLEPGGWNYGNTTVYGQQLRPMPDTTGVALQALTGSADLAEIERSLDYLESHIADTRTPLSLAWSLIGLSAWERRPPDTENLVAATLKIESRFGTYPTTHLCLLLLGLASEDGLNGMLLQPGGPELG